MVEDRCWPTLNSNTSSAQENSATGSGIGLGSQSSKETGTKSRTLDSALTETETSSKYFNLTRYGYSQDTLMDVSRLQSVGFTDTNLGLAWQNIPKIK